MTPSALMTPARYSSATTSMIPDPQIPVTPVPAAETAAENPGSSDQASTPMIRNRGSSVSRSIRTRSIAPGAARCPALIWAPSNAGPVGLLAASRRCRSPSTISAFVPTSTTRVSASASCGSSARITPAVSAPTWPAMHGRTYTRAPGWARTPSSAVVVSTAPSVASANGAEPSGVGSMPSRRWCMIGLPTITSSRISARLMPARLARVGEQPVERLADRGRQLGVAALVHHHVRDPAHEVLAEADLRVHHPGAREDRAVGQVGQVTGDRGRADVDRDPEGAVVEAGPDPDDIPTAVDRDGHAIAARGECRLEGADDRQVGAQVVQTPLRSQGVEQPAQVPGRGGEIRLGDVDGVQADDRVHLERSRRQVLADHLAVDLALGRDVDDEVAGDVRRARQAPVGREAVLRPVGRLDATDRRQVVGRGRDPVLGERPESGRHGAPAADPATAADRVDIDAQRPTRVEHGRARAPRDRVGPRA